MGGVYYRILGCLVAVFLMGHSGVAEQLLASWEEGVTTPSHTPVPGVGATLGLTLVADTFASGSTDGTYGTFGSGASVIPNSFRIQNAETFTVTVNNNSISNLNLAAIRFDFARRFTGSPEELSVTYQSGDLAAGPVVLFTDSVGQFGSDSGDYPDFDVLLSPALADTELAPSESAVFTLVISGGSGARSLLDNLAVTGEFTTLAVPLVSVVVDADQEKFLISKYVTASSQVYTWGMDEDYADGSLSAWHKSNNVHTTRFPAGQAAYYNWEDPSGEMGQSSLDPAWSGPYEDAAKWMSMDEYLDHCIAADITKPTIGVNYSSWVVFGLPQQESIDRAVRQVQRVNSRGFFGSFFYIGNEDLAKAGGRVPGAADNFVAHAQAMKEVDPNLVLFWNDNGLDPTRLQDHLAIVGTLADGAEYHDKWPAGGTWPTNDYATLSMWQNEVPLMHHKHGMITYRDRAAELRQKAAELGRPDFLLMNNEWGLNGDKNKYDDSWDRYTKSLMAVEVQLEMIISGLDMSAFWDLMKGGDHKMLDKSNDNRMNPMHFGFELMNDAPGSMMVDMTTDVARVHGFTSKDDTSFYIHLINKTDTAQPISVSLSGQAVDTLQVPVGVSMVDTGDHWGTNQNLAVTYQSGPDTFTGTLPAMSFNRIILPRDKGGDLTAPAAPVALTASPGNNQIGLDWPDSTEPDLSEYRIYRSTKSQGFYRLLVSNLQTSNYIDTHTVVNDVTYFYKVQAVDASDNSSDFSPEAFALAGATSYGHNTLLFGWDQGITGDPDYSASEGVDTSITGVDGGSEESSNDETWGSQSETPSPGTNNSAFTVFEDDVATIYVKNSTGEELLLTGLFFDYNKVFGGSPKDLQLTYSAGDLDDSPPLVLYTSTGHVTSAWTDHDIWFDGRLMDRTLAHGEEAYFELRFSNASGGGRGDLDNFLLGTSEPPLFISSVKAATNNTLNIKWRSMRGVSYAIMSKTNLMDSSWVTNKTGIFATPITNSTSVEMDSSEQYFRVEVE